MAKIGFEYVVVGKLNETDETAPAYGSSMYFGPNAAFNVTVNSNDVKDYGDDSVAETDTTVIDATISVEHNELTLEQEAYLLGHTISNGTVSNKSTDEAPFVGIGFVGKSRRNGSVTYTAKMYYKVQFKQPGDDNATKQDSTSFSHTTLEGNIYPDKYGNWKQAKEFSTLSAAKSFLNGIFSIT